MSCCPFKLAPKVDTPWRDSADRVNSAVVLDSIRRIVFWDEWVEGADGWTVGLNVDDLGSGFFLAVSHRSWPAQIQLATKWISVDETWTQDWSTDDPTILAQRLVDLANDLVTNASEIFGALFEPALDRGQR